MCRGLNLCYDNFSFVVGDMAHVKHMTDDAVLDLKSPIHICPVTHSRCVISYVLHD